jgi:hypothetical protein
VQGHAGDAGGSDVLSALNKADAGSELSKLLEAATVEGDVLDGLGVDDLANGGGGCVEEGDRGSNNDDLIGDGSDVDDGVDGGLLDDLELGVRNLDAGEANTRHGDGVVADLEVWEGVLAAVAALDGTGCAGAEVLNGDGCAGYDCAGVVPDSAEDGTCV